MQPLALSCDPHRWRLFETRQRDERFRTFRDRVLARDDQTCQFCGFKSTIHMQVVNVDGDYRHNRLSNLATACPFCTQCHFLEMIGSMDMTGGTMVYMPEFTQTELNGLCHVLFCAISGATDYAQTAQTIYNNLRLRSQVVEETLGKGLSNPSMLAQMIIDTPLNHGDSIQRTVFEHVRCLPSRHRFDPYIQAWTDQALQNMASG